MHLFKPLAVNLLWIGFYPKDVFINPKSCYLSFRQFCFETHIKHVVFSFWVVTMDVLFKRSLSSDTMFM